MARSIALTTGAIVLGICPLVSASVGPKEPEELTVAASTVGSFSQGHSWHLKVAADGQATLTVETRPARLKRFRVSRAELSVLRRALISERFFDLSDDYGQDVPDGSTDTLTITLGQRAKSVRIHFLMNWVHYDPARLVEPSRAVRVFQVIRAWIDDPDAVDLRRYDQMVIDAVKRRVPTR